MTRLRRWLVVALVALTVLGVGRAAAAAGSRMAMVLLVLIPRSHRLAVYEQVTWMAPSGGAVPVLSGHGPVTPINFRVRAAVGDRVWPMGRVRVGALKYFVPWDGTSRLEELTATRSIAALVVMAPAGALTLPAVLNPVWESLAPRRIPGLPDSPRFSVWATGNVRGGQTVGVSLEALGPGGVAVATEPGTVGYPATGALFTVALVLLVLAAWLLVVHWRPLGRPPVDAEARLARLAELDALFRQGRLEEAFYTAERRALLADLTRPWENRR